MDNYAIKFKGYLNDLAGRNPSPGGGSTLAAAVCIGASLIEKSLRFSVPPGDKKFRSPLSRIQKIRTSVIPLIDLDGKVFSVLLRSRGPQRKKLLAQSERIMIDTGRAAKTLLSLTKVVESGVKKCIISDFLIGRDYLLVALSGVVLNLEANAHIFGRKSSAIRMFKTILRQWQKS